MRFILVKEKALFQVLFQNDNRYYKKYFMNNCLLTYIIPYFEKEKNIMDEWFLPVILRKDEKKKPYLGFISFLISSLMYPCLFGFESK